MAPGAPFGPGIVALVTYLHCSQMVGYARMVEVLDGVFGLTISEGAIARMLARAEAPFAAEADRIAATVPASAVIASDETSARVKGKTWWQWTFNCATAVYHVIAETRGKCVPTGFLGTVRPKVWVSDRYGGQGKLADAHQYCLAHLIRDAQYAIDAGDTMFEPAFKALLLDACAVGRRRSALPDVTIAAHARRLRRELARVLDCEPTVRAGCKLRDAIDLEARDKLLVFLTRRDVEPTNNASERALRMSVIFRKVTNGFRSTWGAKVYADVCSIVATGRMAGQTALAAIRAALARPAAA
jgi:transposase